MPNFPLTDEQKQIVAAAVSGEDVIVEAGAGSGKTSTLSAVAEALPGKRILYLAFSKTLQLEASEPGRFPSNVEARTAHSLAYRQFGARNKHRMGKFPKGREIATALSIPPYSYKDQEGGDIEIAPRQSGTMVRETIDQFCKSKDRKPTAYHIRRGAHLPATLKDAEQERFITFLLSFVTRAWEDIANPKGTLPFMPGRGDGCYLKLWSLSDPQLPYDVVLFDEAQDADPAIEHVVSIQDKAQKILVGDRAQAIYGWRGAVDAMEKFDAKHHLYLSKSFRFGQAVAEQANRWLSIVGTPLRLTGFEKIESTVDSLESPQAVLCRTNAGVIESAMNFQEQSKRVAIVGGTKQIEGFVKGAHDLMGRISTDFPELAGYKDWAEVCTAVQNGEANDIAMMVRLVNNYGTEAILEVCRNSTKPEYAEVLVSTAHKAKGLEWDSVRIHNDFQPPKDGGQVSVPEAMLIYVAVTRAKKTLDNGALAWLDQLEAEIADKMNEEDETE